jgi:hypothetical protein
MLLAAAPLLWLCASVAARALTGEERLEGVVVDGGGAPAGGVVVILAGRGVRRDTLTNDGGGFQMDPVAPGTYLLSASAGSIASGEVRIQVRDGEAPPHVTLVLKPPVSLDGEHKTHESDPRPPNDSLRPDGPLPSDDLPSSNPFAGRLEVLQAGANLLNDRFETGRTPVVNPGPPSRHGRCPFRPDILAA